MTEPKKEEDKKDAKEDSGSDIDDDDPEVLAIAEQLRAKRIAAAEKKGNFDAQAMPTGGKRVPKGMEAHSDWMSLPEVEIKPVPSSEFGSEYVQLENLRNKMAEMKKSLAALSPPLAVLLKHFYDLKQAQEAKDEKQVAKVTKAIEAEEKKRTTVIKAFEAYLKDFPTSTPTGEQIAAFAKAAGEIKEKEQQLKFEEKSKQFQSFIFREMGKLLQGMKDAKKKHLASKGAKGDDKDKDNGSGEAKSSGAGAGAGAAKSS